MINHWWKWLSGFLLLMLAVAATGCGGRASSSPPTDAKPETAYTVVDVIGHTLRLNGKPRRIVSLTLGTDEILLDMIGPERIVALTKFAHDPGISNVVAKAAQVRGKIVDVNVEAVLSHQPDLVIAADVMYRDVYRALRDMGVPIYVYNNIRSVDDIRQGIESVGRAVDEPAAADVLVRKMEGTLAAVRQRVTPIPPAQRQTVVWISAMGMQGGKGSLFDSMCEHAGVINGAAAIGLEKNDVLSKENIIRINPDIFLMPTWSYEGKVDLGKFRSEVADDPALKTVKAIRNQRLLSVSDQYMYCSSHYIADGVRALAAAAYPDHFR